MAQTALQHTLRNKLRCIFKAVTVGIHHACFQVKDVLLMVPLHQQGNGKFGTFLSGVYLHT